MARVPKFNGSGALSQVAAQPAPSSTAGAGFGALADLAQMGADVLRPKAIENAKIRGAESVYRDANGQLKVDDKSVLGGELADAHNSAAFAKYLSQRSIDIRDTMTELAVKHEFDPAGFREATDSYVALLREDEDVPALLREDVISQAQNEASRRFNGLMVSEVDRTNREANVQTAAHRDALSDDYVNLMMNGDTEGAAEVYKQMEEITRFRSNAPFITETPAQSEAYLSGTRGAARAATLTRRLEDLTGAREITPEEREEIQSLLDSPDIDPQTRIRLYGATQGRLKGIDGRAAADALGATDTAAAVRNFGYGSTGEIPAGYLNAIRTAESGGNDSARNSKSSATGRYQFIESTWSDLMQKHPELGLTPQGRLDPAQQERAIRAFTNDNARVLAGAGIPASGGNLYAAHFLGAGDATRVLSSDDSAQISSIVSQQVMDANPFLKGMTVGGFRDWSARKGGDEGVTARPPVDMEGNRIALTDAGINVTPGSEFFAGAIGVGEATALYQADPEAMASEVLSPEVIEANPVMSNMTVAEAQAWADRRAVVKASDIAQRRTQVDQIEDEEVRRIALTSLNELYNQRRRDEDAALMEYQERLDAKDDTLTEREVMADHSLSDQGQRTLASKLRDQNKAAIEIGQTIADINDPGVTWDMFDTTQRNSVDDAYRATIGDASPLSPEGQISAASIAVRTGFVPKSMFNAIRGAVNGSDPEAMGAALEFAAQITNENPAALHPYGGRSEVASALDDYRFYSSFMGPDAAAARIIENNSPENQARRSNLSDQARDAAKDLKPDDIVSFMSDRGVSVDVPEGDVQAVMMGDYERFFRDAFTATGDVSLAKNRALSDVSRIYGPSGINGSEAIMRHPPTAYYAPVDGSQDWMGEQLVADVTTFAYGESEPLPEGSVALTASAVTSLFTGPTRVDQDRIMLTSDARTAQDVAAGRPPSYVVRFMDDDDIIQEVPGRYRFDRPPETPNTTAAAEMTQAVKDRNMRMWVDHYQAQGLPMNEYNSTIMADMERHTTTAPPGM